jgi:hypothetical protein
VGPNAVWSLEIGHSIQIIDESFVNNLGSCGGS